MNRLVRQLKIFPKFAEFLSDVEKQKGPILVSGLTDVGMTQQIVATQESINKPVVILTYNELQARKLVKDLQYLAGMPEKVVFFPKREIVTYDYIAESKDLPYERMEALSRIQENKAKFIVTSIEAWMQPMIPSKLLFQNILSLKNGETYPIDTIKEKLVKMGYVRYDLIDGKGQFSIRGGIMDISTSEDYGIRIEFWGNEVDSIRKFNIVSQRSTEMIEKVTIYPIHEYLAQNLDEICEKINSHNYTKQQEEFVKEDIEIIKNGDYISKVDKYFTDFYPEYTYFSEYLEKATPIFLDDINKLEIRSKNIMEDTNSIMDSLIQKEKIIPQALQEFLNFEQIMEKLPEKTRIVLEKQDVPTKSKGIQYHYQYREKNYYKSGMEGLLEEIPKWLKAGKKIYLLAGTKEKAHKWMSILNEETIPNIYDENISEVFVKSNREQENLVVVTTGVLSAGMESYDLGLIVIAADQLVEAEKTRKKKSVHSSYGEGEKVVFADLKMGDYVVHKNHGIGQFIGVNTITTDHITKDYIKIKYKDEDILYVPTNQLDNIRKYVGGGEVEPKLNRLGSKDWENTKAKVKKNLREVAKELIELYAKRQKVRGHAFSKDTPWQQEFENSFPYQETDDQLRCIEEVKKDMEMQKPMDRLLCGDVGYGKTEVAIRAAFKAVMDQKQVAYLCPTTVLANQQFEEFKERMEEFPIRVEVLNRFKTKKEQTQIIKKLKLGEIDVVIGTHRLLSSDIEFKDLGLLIIDEEHRFGVKAKEKIKEYKTSVDVLTMTATPIPRTLHMSIVGVRDMSIIYEPPQNRKPVQTYVLEYDEEVIKEAITKELERGGQVFYLYNNVEGIEKRAIEIGNLVPEANVSYAHGQMSGNELENIMLNFIEQKSNVLVCTTILESGIDIPNANTIIVENADRLGLAQLYQIRGRVGRSDRQAYAYITYKRDKLISEVADKRLKAIKEFTEFGSGFKIAMRDLEIRGAGSLLGEMQHGHLEQVGYDTYCNLLDEVVKEMQGEVVEVEEEIQIDLNISSYIPDTYIENSSQKIEIYQDIALSKTEEDIRNVIDELIDRYGEMPSEVENLLEVARIKMLCRQDGVVKITQRPESFVIYYSEKMDKENFSQKVDTWIEKYGDRIRFSPGGQSYVTYKTKEKKETKALQELKEFLKEE